jgi:glycosyltransferase involved in cell wall biosynthesis
MTALSYALVTPARNEADNLRRLAACVAEQTVPPLEWVIVDDGSTDDTAHVAAELAGREPWVQLLASPGALAREGGIGDGRRSGRDIVAFKTGIEALRQRPDVVLKLDADVSFTPDFFACMLAAFDAEPRLGVAGGTCYEQENGRWLEYRVTGDHVRGATRAYRWSCLEDVSPLEERIGWEAVDEARAALHGWFTRTLPDLAFYHHRRLGGRDGARRAWIAQGHLAHYLGYRISFMVLKLLWRMRREPAAIAMLWGYAGAAVRREERYPDPAVRAYLRRKQSIRALPLRLRQALRP